MTKKQIKPKKQTKMEKHRHISSAVANKQKKGKSTKSKPAKSKHHQKHHNQDPDDSDIDIDDVDDFDPVDHDNSYQENDEASDANETNEASDDSDAGSEEDEAPVKPKVVLALKTKEKLKNKINSWLDYDDKIKELNGKTKKYKDAKKQQEDTIISMITKLGMEDNKIDVTDNKDQLRGRVYRYRSVTKGGLKEDIIKDALMEAIRDEKKVDQLVKKIESKRPINERYYLKRTKGNKDD